MADGEQMKKPSWWDEHVSLGNIMNLVLLVFLAGGFYVGNKLTLERYDDVLLSHGERLSKVEELNIRTAEVVIQMSQFQRQLERTEIRLTARIDELARRLENLERDVRHGREQADHRRRNE